jgi:hypothetical protein
MLPCQSILFAKTNIMLLNNAKFQIDLFFSFSAVFPAVAHAASYAVN